MRVFGDSPSVDDDLDLSVPVSAAVDFVVDASAMPPPGGAEPLLKKDRMSMAYTAYNSGRNRELGAAIVVDFLYSYSRVVLAYQVE